MGQIPTLGEDLVYPPEITPRGCWGPKRIKIFKGAPPLAPITIGQKFKPRFKVGVTP